jgi:hypothetical protein
MAPWREQLRLVWEQYLSGGDGSALHAFIEAHPKSMTDCGHEYPYLHRVCDVRLGGRPFRVGRCITCGEELSFTPVNECLARVGVAGVPYWLSGAKLAQWVEQEVNGGPDWKPARAVDWKRYL